MKTKNRVELSLIVVIIGLAAFLRLVNLAENPSWYVDEGTHLNIARNLLDGRVQYMAVGDSTLLFARLPLFEYMLAGAIAFFGERMLTLRTFTALLGVCCVGLTWGMLRRLTEQRWLALSGAFSLAIYPNAILYSRFGFSYNLLSVFVLITIWGLGEFQHSRQVRWLGLGVLGMGLGCISDIAMLVMLVPYGLFLGFIDWRQLRWTVPLILTPFIVYLSYLFLTVPDALQYDWQFTFNRVQSPLDQQVWNVARNYTILLTQDIRALGGIIGLFLITKPALRWLLLGFALLPIVIMGRVIPLYGLSYYYLVPILPLLAIGFGILVYQSILYLWQMIPNSLPQVVAVSAILILVAVPILVEVDETARRVQSHWTTIIEVDLVEADAAHASTDYVNSNLQTDDTVIVAPTLAWLIDGDVVDFITAPAILTEDNTFIFWETIELPAARFKYDPRYHNARYAIVDNLWRKWGCQAVDGITEMLVDIEENWEIVFQMGSVTVYENLNES